MRRGFALSMSMIILLIFISMILVIQYQRTNIEESTRADHARLRAITEMFKVMDSESFNDSLRALARDTLSEMSEEVIENGYFQDSKKEFCNRYVKKLKDYSRSLKERGKDLGIELKIDENSYKCEVDDSKDPFNISLQIGFEIQGSGEGIPIIVKSIDRNLEVNIEGIPDPLIGYESKKVLGTPEIRPIIKYKDQAPKSNEIAEGIVGQGWIYGHKINPRLRINKKPSILVVNAYNGKINSLRSIDLSDYDGIVLLGPNNGKEIKTQKTFSGTTSNGQPCTVSFDAIEFHEEAPCLNCGIYGTVYLKDTECKIEYDSNKYVKDGNKLYYYEPRDPNDPQGYQSGKNIRVEIPFIKITKGTITNDFLINTDTGYKKDGSFIPVYDNSKLIDIEDLRGAVLCGQYFESTKGATLLERMEGKIETGDNKGIETFVLGLWAREPYSKLDHEYFSQKGGELIKGMPTCLTIDMCNKDDSDISIGHFRISRSSSNRYGMTYLRWKQ